MSKRSNEDSLQPTPLPQRQKSGNLERRTKRTKDKRTPSVPAEKYQQISLRVPPSTRSAFDAAFEESGIESKVKFMAALLESWENGSGSPDPDRVPKPSAADVAGGRTEEFRAWVRPELASTVVRASRSQKQPLGEVLDRITGYYVHHVRAASTKRER